jgi:hypothetical protein
LEAINIPIFKVYRALLSKYSAVELTENQIFGEESLQCDVKSQSEYIDALLNPPKPWHFTAEEIANGRDFDLGH